MRIEILVDNEDPQIFPLKNSKITIGSHEGCDIMLNAEGVSRKHLQVISEDDKYYVVDQGSTNGTYINEERLVPGRRAEFTSFFPVRLGDRVLITLLSDAEADDLGYTEEKVSSIEASSPNIKRPSLSTRTIALTDLQSGKTENLVKKRQESVKKRKISAPPPKKAPLKDRRRMLLVQIFSFVILGAAAYYNLVLLEPEPEMIPEPIQKVGEVIKAEPATPVFAQVDKADLTPLNRFPEMIKEITCTGDREIFFCRLYQDMKIKYFGVLQVGTMINSMVNGLPYLERARAILPRPIPAFGGKLSQEQILKFENELNFTAMILFLNDLPPLDLERFKDFNLTFLLLISEPATPPKFIGAAVVPSSFNALKERLKDSKHFEYAKKNGAEAIFFLKNYFTFY